MTFHPDALPLSTFVRAMRAGAKAADITEPAMTEIGQAWRMHKLTGTKPEVYVGILAADEADGIRDLAREVLAYERLLREVDHLRSLVATLEAQQVPEEPEPDDAPGYDDTLDPISPNFDPATWFVETVPQD